MVASSAAAAAADFIRWVESLGAEKADAAKAALHSAATVATSSASAAASASSTAASSAYAAASDLALVAKVDPVLAPPLPSLRFFNLNPFPVLFAGGFRMGTEGVLHS
jgi:hypothetical protein